MESLCNLSGKVNFTATAEALQSAELCGNELPRVPAQGHKDTVVKPLLVEVCRYTFSDVYCIIAYYLIRM